MLFKYNILIANTKKSWYVVMNMYLITNNYVQSHCKLNVQRKYE